MQTNQFIMEILKTMKYEVMVFISGKMAKGTKENGFKTRCTEMEHCSGLTERNILVNFVKISVKEMVNFTGMMEGYTMDSG